MLLPNHLGNLNKLFLKILFIKRLKRSPAMNLTTFTSDTTTSATTFSMPSSSSFEDKRIVTVGDFSKVCMWIFVL